MAIERILLAVGPDDEANADALAEAAAEVAVPTGARVVIAHVFSEAEFEATRDRLAESGESASNLTVDQVAERHAAVRSIVERLEDADVAVEIRGRVGEKARLVVDLAEEVGADRVIVGGRQRSPAGKAIFGSVAQAVLLSAPCPVTYVRSES